MHDDFFELLAMEAAKSPIVAAAIAKNIELDDKITKSISDNLDPEVMARLIAQHTIDALNYQTHSTNIAVNNARSTVAQVMKRAKEIAAQIVGEEMAKSAMKATTSRRAK